MEVIFKNVEGIMDDTIIQTMDMTNQFVNILNVAPQVANSVSSHFDTKEDCTTLVSHWMTKDLYQEMHGVVQLLII